MQTVIGRITSHAAIATLKDGRQVVNFTVAENARVKVKGSDEVKQLTNFYQCAYWMGTGIVDHLKKGVLVDVSGRIGVNAWQNASGEARATLTLHVQQINLHGKAAGNRSAEATNEAAAIAAKDNTEDLPF